MELNHRHADFQNLYGLLTRRGLLFETYAIQALSGNQGKLAEAHGSPKTPFTGPILVQHRPNDGVESATPLSPRNTGQMVQGHLFPAKS